MSHIFFVLTVLDIGSSLEIYFRDTRNLLVIFSSQKDRQSIHTRLAAIQSASGVNDGLTPSVLRTALLSKVGARLFSGFRDEISTAQRRWQAREISNVIDFSTHLPSEFVLTSSSLLISASLIKLRGERQAMLRSILFTVRLLWS